MLLVAGPGRRESESREGQIRGRGTVEASKKKGTETVGWTWL